MNPHNSPTLFAPAGGTDAGGGTDISGAIAETKTKIAQSARDAASKVKSAASNTAAKAKDEAQRLVSDKKEETANRIGGYSSAIHDSAKSLEEKDPNIAWFTHQAADKLQNVAEYVRRCDLDGLRRDVQDVARRHPVAFFGGMFLTGLILGNVMKASRSDMDTDDSFGFDRDDNTNRSLAKGENADEQSGLGMAERNAAGI
jgi:hypothetical protein